MPAWECPTQFKAGPLQAIFAAGDLRYLKVGGMEILRRVYVAVRDAAWGTIPGVLRDLSHRQDDDGFQITYAAEHREGEIAFAWRSTIEARSTNQPDGSADVVITFTMDGQALSTFQTNRTGFCILHPIDECAGRDCTIENDRGQIVKGHFSELIAPHQPLTNIRSITYEPAPGLQAELRFEGELFETEDQRNWTDGSYKTYCRPLSLGFPYELRKGQRIQQTVKLRVTGKVPISSTTQNELVIGKSLGQFPRIGLRIARDSQPLSDLQIERLESLHLSHLRADLYLNSEHAQRDLSRAAAEATALGVPLELGVHLSDSAEDELRHLKNCLTTLTPGSERSDGPDLPPPLKRSPDVVRCLVYRQREPMVSPQWVDLARQHLQAYDPSMPIGGGTIGNFAELNRNRPSAKQMQVLAYPVNPQIHATDDLSVMENLQGQAGTVTTARTFAPHAWLAVSPVMLHRRPDPFAAGKSGAEETVRGDPRQRTLFGAAWTLASIKYLAEAGADSITCYETTGEFGVMDADGVFPLYHVLADVGEFASGTVRASQSSNPLVVECLAIQHDTRMRIIVANLTAQAQQTSIRGLKGEWRTRTLTDSDSSTTHESPCANRAGPSPARNPHPPHNATEQALQCADDRLDLRLPPHAVVRLDGDAHNLSYVGHAIACRSLSSPSPGTPGEGRGEGSEPTAHPNGPALKRD